LSSALAIWPTAAFIPFSLACTSVSRCYRALTFRQFIPLTEYSLEAILLMNWEVEYTTAFAGWWDILKEAEQESVAASVRLLEEYGPYLRYPHSSHIHGTRCGHMRELRIQHDGNPYR